MFENPALQKFYRGLEAFALDRDDIEEYKDLTVPNAEAIQRKAGELISNFNSAVFPQGYSADSAAKRKTPSGGAAGGGGVAKKPKVDLLVDVNVKDVAEKGNLKKLTVPVLKQFCQTTGIKAASQKKGDLIDAINNHFSF